MAIFNPQVSPGRDDMPNYFKYSSPISGVEADKSTGLALAAVGTSIESAAVAGEKIAKDVIGEDVRKTVEPIREKFSQDLETIRNAQVGGNVIPNAVSTGRGPVVMSEEEQPQKVPMAIDNSLSKIQSLQSALASGKGVNDTYYDLNLKSAVTQLRQRYPGFVDYIDEKVSSITGINPANAYINNLMQDINKATSSKKTEEDKVLDIARTQGIKYDKGNLMYERLKADPSFEKEFMRWYSEENAKDGAISRSQSELNLKKARGEDTTKDSVKVMSDYISSKIDGDLNATLTLAGTNKPETIMGILDKAKNDPNAYSGEQMEEFATKLLAHKEMLRAQLTLLTNQKGFTKDVGAQARDAELESQLKLYEGMYNAVRGGGAGGAGLAFFQANQTRAVLDQTRRNLTSGDLGRTTNNFQILSEKLGPIITAKVLTPMMMEELSKTPDRLKPLLTEKMVEARAQPGGEDKPTTLAGHMAQVGNDDRLNKEEKAYVYKGLTNVVKDITNKDMSDEGKAGAVRYLFNPKNNGVLQSWKMDYRTTSPDGRLKIEHPGKYAIWTSLTNDDVSDNISKLDDKSKNYYRSWVDITGRELIGEDVRNLNHFTGHDNLYFEWSRGKSGSPMLVLKDNEGGLASPVGKTATIPGNDYSNPNTTGYRYQVQTIVDRINRAIPNLEHVYKNLGGGNTEVMLLQTLQQYGMDFNGKISGLPKAFGDAIAASRKKPEEKK